MSYGDMKIESNSKFLKIESGKSVDIHILSKEPVKQLIHGFGQEKLSCSGTGCQMCEDGETPKQRWFINIFDRKDNRVKIFEFGPMIASQIKAIAEMLEEGNQTIHDIDLRIKAEGTKPNVAYTVMQKPILAELPQDLQLHKLI